jgi:hypothetical protein
MKQTTNYNTTEAVKQIGTMEFTGNVIPHAWYQNNLLKLENGRSNLLAITILSDIIYWYRPTIVIDEGTGHIKSVNKKFQHEKLHKTYQSWAVQFGVSKRSVQEACYFLKRKGLISIEIKDGWVVKNSPVMNNVTFFEPIPEMILVINDPTKVDNYPLDWSAAKKDNGIEAEVGSAEMSSRAQPGVTCRTPECETNTEITSETSTEITPNTWSEASSDEIKENSSVDSGNPEKVEALVLANKKNKAATKRELMQAAVNDPKSIAFFENLRNKFQLYSGNGYLRSFAAHKTQFYKTLAYRVAAGEVTQASIEEAFYEMTLSRDFSIMQFLEKLKNPKYTDTKVLVDFICVMLDGKISAFAAEKKGAKELSEWIEDGKVTLTEIEDCFLWLPNSGRGYKQSLISLKAALSAFDTVKTLSSNGRFSGKSLNAGYKTSSEKSLEILQQRDYNRLATEILEESEAKKRKMAELIAIADGKK